MSLKNRSKKEILALDTRGIDLFEGDYTRYGEVSVYPGALQKFQDRLGEPIFGPFDVALLLSFVCTNLVDAAQARAVARVKEYLVNMPGLNKESRAKEEARQKKYEDQQARARLEQAKKEVAAEPIAQAEPEREKGCSLQ